MSLPLPTKEVKSGLFPFTPLPFSLSSYCSQCPTLACPVAPFPSLPWSSSADICHWCLCTILASSLFCPQQTLLRGVTLWYAIVVGLSFGGRRVGWWLNEPCQTLCPRTWTLEWHQERFQGWLVPIPGRGSAPRGPFVSFCCLNALPWLLYFWFLLQVREGPPCPSI